MTARYVVNVQILRFFAALAVALAHMGVAVEERFPEGGPAFRMIYPLDWGIGVDIFFIISGFIMYYLMQGRFGTPSAPAYFLKRRLLRIVPLYWLCTVLMLVSVVFAGSAINNNTIDPAHLAASFLFIPWPRTNGEMFPFLSLGWTLNYEILFYLIFAAGLFFARRTGLTVVLALFAALITAACFAPEDWLILRFWGNGIIGEFLLGILLAAAFLRGIQFRAFTGFALVLAGIGLAVVFYQTESYLVLSRFFTGGIPAAMIAAGVILMPPAPDKAHYRAMTVAGDASYALYLTHPFTSKAVAIIGAKVGLSPLLIFAGGIVACIAVSVAVYFLFEKPVGKALNRLAGSRGGGGQAGA